MTCATVQLADGLTIHFPGDGRDSHVLELADHRLLRVGADAARFAEWLSAHPGEVDAAAVAADLGPAWTPGAVEALINALITSGAVRPTDEAPPERRRPGRVRISGPLSVQFTLANPTRVYTPIAGWLHRMIPAIGTAVGALSVAGVLLLTWMMGQPDAPIFEPASAGTYLWTMVLLYLTVAIHEFSHGAVLVSYGGMPAGWVPCCST